VLFLAKNSLLANLPFSYDFGGILYARPHRRHIPATRRVITVARRLHKLSAQFECDSWLPASHPLMRHRVSVLLLELVRS